MGSYHVPLEQIAWIPGYTPEEVCKWSLYANAEQAGQIMQDSRYELAFCTASVTASKSSQGIMRVPPIIGEKGVLYCCLYVKASAPIVRPWKELVNDTIS